MSDADAFRRMPLEVFNQGRVELIDELLAPDFVEHIQPPPGLPEGPAGLRAFVSALRGAFPDFRYEMVQQFQDGNIHIGHVRATGTMTGDFMGMPATGKAATWEEIHIGRMRDGRLTEHWAVVDRLGMLEQLGLVPTNR